MRCTRRAFLIHSLRATAGAAVLTAFGGPLAGLASAGAPRTPIEDFPDRGVPAGPFTSAPRALPAGTTHVGIHWAGEARTTATVYARTFVDGVWSEWMQLELEEAPPGSDETFGALIDADGASQVQYRVELPGGRRLNRVTVTTINAATVSSASTPGWSFALPDGSGQRGVFTREDWGCDESLGFSGTTRIWPAMFVPAKKLIVHHTATSNRYSDGAAEVRAVYAYHAKTQGWGDIGYNSLIDRFGNVYEGRRGRETNPREILSSGVVAGHVYHHNYGTTGVAVLGDFTKRKISSSNTNDVNMMKALEDVIVYECWRARMPAKGASDFLCSNDTWHTNRVTGGQSMPTITGHKDSYSTACPGTNLYNQLPTLRDKVAARLSSLATPVVSFGTPLPAREAAKGADLTFNWSGSGAGSYDYRLEGWRRIPTSNDDIYYIYQDGSTWVTTATTEPTGWVGADKTGWTAGAGPATFSGLPAGHYTLHVRGYNASEKLSAVEANFTVLVK